MGTIGLPISFADFHRGGHPEAFAFGQPARCLFCGMTRAEQRAADAERRRLFWAEVALRRRGD